MKITIQYDNEEEARWALNAPLMSGAIHNFAAWLRAQDKYSEKIPTWEAVREEFYSEFREFLD